MGEAIDELVMGSFSFEAKDPSSSKNQRELILSCCWLTIKVWSTYVLLRNDYLVHCVFVHGVLVDTLYTLNGLEEIFAIWYTIRLCFMLKLFHCPSLYVLTQKHNCIFS